MSDHVTCLAAFEDASGSKYVWVLNMAWLCMERLHRVLNMSEYGSICLNKASIMPQYISICFNVLNMPEHGSIAEFP